MKKMVKIVSCFVMTIVLMVSISLCVYATGTTDTETNTTEVVATQEETTEADSTGDKALASGIAIGLAAMGGSIGMGIAIGKSSEGISRQPEAEGKIRTNLMLGLVFIETAIIYALIIAILLIFVL